MMKKSGIILFILSFLFSGLANKSHAQEKNGADPIQGKIEKLSTEIGEMKKLKISGYLQFQGQMADSAGQASIAGGSFVKNTDHRFMIRRGRVKFNYATPSTNYVLQLDVTEKGFALKDLYLTYTDPIFNLFTLTAGQFNRPFGYEIEYSSSLRESPERSRFTQTIFPGERDLGAKITIQPRKSSKWNIFKLDAGIFNGNGPNVVDFDNRWDFISHLSYNQSFSDDHLKIGLGGSFYKGFFKNSPDASNALNVYEYTDNASGYTKLSNPEDYSGRHYAGLDFQLAYNSPVGLSIFRAEYITGTNAGSSTSSGTPTALLTSTHTLSTDTVLNTQGQPVVITRSESSATGDPTYLRNFSGYYAYFCQNLGNSKHQLVVKYDVYDPNTKVSGTDIGNPVTGGKATNSADIRYSTLGLGWVYRLDTQIKLMAYYDMITNESTSLWDSKNKINYKKDLKDNVLTIRLQYKF